MPNALLMFSGGLDSMLAVKVLQEQDIEVEALCFVSDFYNADKAGEGARAIGVKLHTLDIKKEMLNLVKNPPHGYGKNMNPCIDCHGLMFKKAGEFAREHKFDFIATGEVLGQRPFSQNKDALLEVQRLAGVPVLRPLCAKLLPETAMEKQGLVIRGRLKDIKGRGRERQFELAKKYGLKEYPSPAGGCLLTDPGFSERLLKLLDNWPEAGSDDVEVLKHGRVGWLQSESGSKILYVIGRRQADNEALAKLAKKGDYVVELKHINGPLTLVRGLNNGLEDIELILDIPEKLEKSRLKMAETKNGEEIIRLAALLTGFYATKARDKAVELKVVGIDP